MAVIELACYIADCAPPPVGTGGSKRGAIPYSIGQSDENLKRYKGTFKVPGVAAIKKIVGKSIEENVAHFAQYGIELTIDDWAGSGDFANQRYAALFALDKMAQDYPEQMRGLPVNVNMTGGFGDTVGMFKWSFDDGSRSLEIEMNASWVLGRDATPNEYRRLYAAGVIHEIGHVLTYDAVGRDPKRMQELRYAQEIEIGGVKIRKGTKNESVSEYGTTYLTEDIAESFTAHVLGIPAPDDVGQRWVADQVRAIGASGSLSSDGIVYRYAIAERESALVSSIIELACRSASCAPPPIGTGGSEPGAGTGLVSTRMPTAVAAEKPVTGLGTHVSEISVDASLKQAVMVASNVPGFSHLLDLPGFAEGASDKDKKAAVQAVVVQMADNIVEVFDRSKNPEISRHWYDAANQLSKDWGKEYGLHPDTVAAVIAVMSPQNPWENNITQAHTVLEFMRDQTRAVSSSELKAINRVITQQYDNRVRAWENRIKKAESEGDLAAAERIRSRPPKAPSHLDPDSDITVADLSDMNTAYLIRHLHEGSNKPQQYLMTLDDKGGYELGGMTKKNGDPKLLVWNSYNPIANAVSVIRDSSPENVSKALGGEHKVRSFYNNIAYPDDANHDVTGDTHSFGVSFRIPVGSSHTLISTKKGSVSLYSRPTNAEFGTSGVHVLVAEAHRVAARRINRRRSTKRPYLPREIQSITWEQWRLDYPAANRAGKGSNLGLIRRVENALRASDAENWSSKRLSDELARIRATPKLEDQ